MQLHYNILWIDNDLPEYEERGAITGLNDFLTDLGFEPNIITLYDESELDRHLEETKFDLIISDYQLDDTTGDKIIEHIREKMIMTEILFYSAKTNFRDDEQVQKSLKLIDRISFHYGRDTLLERIEKLIELTLDKLLDLNATRGIITSATSELDVEMEELTLHLLDDKDKSELDAIIEHYRIDFLESQPEKFKSKYEKLGFEQTYRGFIAYRKWRMLRDLLKEYRKTNAHENIDSFLKGNKTYSAEVIDIRNKFAHAKAVKDNGKTVLKGQVEGDDFEFTSDKCIEIRKKIIQHRKHFESIKKHLGI